jgi:hypothetical protein
LLQDFDGQGLIVVGCVNLQDEGTKDIYYNWNKNEMAAHMMEYEEFLQARYFNVTHADSTKAGSSTPPELSKNTMFMYEGDDDEWIFEAFMFTSASEKWMSIESQVVNVTSRARANTY